MGGSQGDSFLGGLLIAGSFAMPAAPWEKVEDILGCIQREPWPSMSQELLLEGDTLKHPFLLPISFAAAAPLLSLGRGWLLASAVVQVALGIVWLKQWGGHAKEQRAPVRLSRCLPSPRRGGNHPDRQLAGS